MIAVVVGTIVADGDGTVAVVVGMMVVVVVGRPVVEADCKLVVVAVEGDEVGCVVVDVATVP